jgi:DNA-binding winged helix-turn-helix (wHTH) protein/tetratricopeptide (TPR) repeat protein
MGRCWYEFGPYRLEPATRALLRDGQIVELTPKAVETLRVLVQRSGQLVSKDDLIREVWPETFVEEGSLTRNISDLRRVLDGPGKHFIETVPRRGYRLIVPVRRYEAESKINGRRVAVLPFETLDDCGSDRNLGLRIADALVIRLATLKETRVQPVRMAGSIPEETPGCFPDMELVLQGTVQRSRKGVRVTVQLKEAQSSTLVSAGNFDESTQDLFLMEDSIGEQIAGATGLVLSTEQRKLLSRRYTESDLAYHLYLKGRFHWGQRSVKEMHRAIKLFRKAVAVDPEYAPAFSALSSSFAFLPMLSSARPREYMPKARASAIAALEIDETLSEARAALAFVRWHYEWNWKAAEQEFRRILKFDPGHALTHQWYGLLLAEIGRYREAVKEAGLACDLDPSPSIRANQAMVLYIAGRYQEAIEIARETLRAFPTSVRARVVLSLGLQASGAAPDAIRELETTGQVALDVPFCCGALGYLYAVEGRASSAQAILRRLESVPTGHVDFFSQAMVHTGMGNIGVALDLLEKAWCEREFHMVLLKIDRRLDCLRTQPRFQSLLRRVGLD